MDKHEWCLSIRLLMDFEALNIEDQASTKSHFVV